MPVTKKCSRCGEDKSLKEFYKQKAGLLGRTGSCKDCRRDKQREYQKTEQSRVLKREWAKKNPEKEKLRNERFKENNPDYWKEYYKQNSEIRIKNNKDWKKRNPERHNFYKRFRRAVISGEIEKSEVCQMCGKNTKVEGHHFDYSNIANMIWVCRPCHTVVHKKRREA